MANEDDFQKRVQDALMKGEPIPGFPDVSPLRSLGMAMHEAVTEFEAAGFNRGEALYLVSGMFNGNPGQSPAVGGGDN